MDQSHGQDQLAAEGRMTGVGPTGAALLPPHTRSRFPDVNALGQCPFRLHVFIINPDYEMTLGPRVNPCPTGLCRWLSVTRGGDVRTWPDPSDGTTSADLPFSRLPQRERERERETTLPEVMVTCGQPSVDVTE
ncbi:hypothetical protein roselon_00543 [Roseibacterium elongatum DSM 19469]|uniref:Uncharacterized protein n=1 Tax=Roseicyclus elongatus DSM 19469 TaxID=1294273 RepID=W8RPP0_9RHOB|nr:hypothetical protein roselon_00543 [Roseibacterium elongatum DSM 19469]